MCLFYNLWQIGIGYWCVGVHWKNCDTLLKILHGVLGSSATISHICNSTTICLEICDGCRRLILISMIYDHTIFVSLVIAVHTCVAKKVSLLIVFVKIHLARCIFCFMYSLTFCQTNLLFCDSVSIQIHHVCKLNNIWHYVSYILCGCEY